MPQKCGPSFQWHVDKAIRDCHTAFAWVDNIVIYSRNHEEHVGNLMLTQSLTPWTHHAYTERLLSICFYNC